MRDRESCDCVIPVSYYCHVITIHCFIKYAIIHIFSVTITYELNMFKRRKKNRTDTFLKLGKSIKFFCQTARDVTMKHNQALFFFDCCLYLVKDNAAGRQQEYGIYWHCLYNHRKQIGYKCHARYHNTSAMPSPDKVRDLSS